MNPLTRLLTVAAAASLAVGVTAVPAFAPKYILGASAFGTCVLPDGDARFQGAMTALGFSVVDGTLSVTANVVGSCADPDANVVATVPQFMQTFPVTSVTTGCDATSATVEIRPGAATVGGVLGDDTKDGEPVKFTLDLDGTVLDRVWSPDEPASVKAKLCAVGKMAAHRPDADLARALNALVLG